LISEVVVVGLDLWALVVVRNVNRSFDHLGVLNTELLHRLRLALELREGGTSQEPFKLLLLVSVSVLLHDNFHGELLQELVFESVCCVLLHT
jgi:hypothetical protein